MFIKNGLSYINCIQHIQNWYYYLKNPFLFLTKNSMTLCAHKKIFWLLDYDAIIMKMSWAEHVFFAHNVLQYFCVIDLFLLVSVSTIFLGTRRAIRLAKQSRQEPIQKNVDNAEILGNSKVLNKMCSLS